MLTLADLAVKTQAKIISYSENTLSFYRQKLLAYGLVPGVSFYVRQVAPLGDPIVIELGYGCWISIRKKEANIVLVEKLDDKNV